MFHTHSFTRARTFAVSLTHSLTHSFQSINQPTNQPSILVHACSHGHRYTHTSHTSYTCTHTHTHAHIHTHLCRFHRLPGAELHTAASEQMKITENRMRALLASREPQQQPQQQQSSGGSSSGQVARLAARRTALHRVEQEQAGDWQRSRTVPLPPSIPPSLFPPPPCRLIPSLTVSFPFVH